MAGQDCLRAGSLGETVETSEGEGETHGEGIWHLRGKHCFEGDTLQYHCVSEMISDMAYR